MNTNYDINYRFVWCTKYMRPVLDGELSVRLESILLEKTVVMDGEIYRVEIQPAWVQITCSFPPRIAPSQIVYALKDYSAHVLRKEFGWLKGRLPNLWTRSYYVGTEGEVNVQKIGQFLVEQARINRPQRQINK